jgi:protein-tyrosine-phosphatase
MLMDYDYIISMAQPEYTPAWLSNDPKYIYWDIEDPGGKDYAKTREAKADVRDHVIRFLAEHDV